MRREKMAMTKDVMKTIVFELIDKELQDANEKFPMFSSNHEAYAVIKEEMEEANEEAENISAFMDLAWAKIRTNKTHGDIAAEWEKIYNAAARMALEAIQTAAMARKAIISARTEGVLGK